MKTVIIWDNCEANIRFLVVDGDYSHLHDKYINCNATEDEADQINEITTSGPPDYKPRLMLDRWPSESYQDDTKIIVCGFIP